MKTTIITVVSALLTALGGAAIAKWALPPESVNEVITGVLGIIGGVFGIVAARHNPAPATAPGVSGDAK